MIDLPILYSFRRCPYAMRARLALAVSGSATILREVQLSRKPVELLAASPKATVPVLVLQNGTVIDESLDIMRWALARNDPEGWLHAGRTATEDLIQANDGPFKHHLDRYKYPDRHGEDPLVHRSAGLDLLVSLDGRLRGQAHLCGDRRSFADAALVPFVRQFAMTDRAWFDAQPLPNLQRWLDQYLSSSLFDRIAVRVPFWSAGDPARIFPWDADGGDAPLTDSGAGE